KPYQSDFLLQPKTQVSSRDLFPGPIGLSFYRYVDWVPATSAGMTPVGEGSAAAPSAPLRAKTSPLTNSPASPASRRPPQSPPPAPKPPAPATPHTAHRSPPPRTRARNHPSAEQIAIRPSRDSLPDG